MSSDPLVKAVASELMQEWFPTGNDADRDAWTEISFRDAELAVRVARSYLAREIEAHARENHRHVDLSGICPVSRSSPDNCDLVAAYLNAARLVRGK
jgi:hypothetical protein